MKKTFLALIIFGGLFIFSQGVDAGCCTDGGIQTPATLPSQCGPTATFSPVDCVAPTPTPGVPTAAPSPSTSPVSTTLTFPNPIAHDTVESLVNSVLDNLRLVIAIIAILFIVIGGIMYMLSFGEEKKMETAKSIITAALIGFAIVLAAPSFLREILEILGRNNVPGVTPADAISIYDIVMGVLKFLLSIVGILGIIGLVVGGIMYMTSYGEEDRMEKGKKILVASIIGIVIALGALVIVNQIAKFFV